MFTKPTSPQSIGQVLDGAFRLASVSFRQTWVLALLAGVASYAASVYQFTRGDTLVQSILAPADAVYWTLYVGGLLLSLLFFSAIYLRVDAIASGTTDGGDTVNAALRRLPLVLLLLVLTLLALAVGFVLLIVPFLILAVSLMLAMPILLIESKGPIDAMTSSHRLIWGHWWRTSAILTVGVIIIMVFYMILGMVAAAVAPMIASGAAEVAAVLSVAIVIGLAGILITPFFVALVLNIYWDLKLRKEGIDLAWRAEAL